MKIKIFRRYDYKHSLWSIAFYYKIEENEGAEITEYYSPVFIFSPKSGANLKDILKDNLMYFMNDLISKEKKRKKILKKGDLLKIKQIFEAYKLPDFDRHIHVGMPTSVGELRELIKYFPDDLSFGFFNQPLQRLSFRVIDGFKCLVFEEIGC